MLLVEAGSEVNAVDKRLRTPLECATTDDVKKYLKAQGAKTYSLFNVEDLPERGISW
jgi:hypothetical protein